MRGLGILIVWAAIGLVVAGVLCYGFATLRPRYTAEAILGVRAPVEVDMFGQVRPGAGGEGREAYGRKMAKLMMSDAILEKLLSRDKVQQTDWFKGMGAATGMRLEKTMRLLERRLCVRAEAGGDLMRVSMTSVNRQDAAVIVNEAIALFVKERTADRKEEISAKLAALQSRMQDVQRDVSASEQALEEVRQRYGFSDLEEHEYRDTVTKRFVELEKQRDECIVEIAAVKAKIDRLGGSGNANASAEVGQKVEEARDELAVLQAKLDELSKLREDAAKEKAQLDMARVQYRQRAAVRDERAAALGSVKAAVEKLRTMYEDPDVSGLRSLGAAPEPSGADGPVWGLWLPAGAGVGLVIGAVHCLLAGSRGKK